MFECRKREEMFAHGNYGHLASLSSEGRSATKLKVPLYWLVAVKRKGQLTANCRGTLLAKKDAPLCDPHHLRHV